jgi:uncharacterized protein YjiK
MRSLTADRRIPVDLEETSDVCPLPGGRFLVVSDVDTRAAVVGADGTWHLQLTGVKKGDSGFEAVTYDAASGVLACHDEERGQLLLHRWDGREGSLAVLEERFAIEVGKKRNKGIEGIVHLDAGASPTGAPGYLLANEDKPQRLYFLADGADDLALVEMERSITEACDDFSGLARDPHRGSFLVVSDESAALVELRLRADEGALHADAVEAYALVDERGKPLERVEGVAVDEEGAWWVLLENDHVLCRVRAS